MIATAYCVDDHRVVTRLVVSRKPIHFFSKLVDTINQPTFAKDTYLFCVVLTFLSLLSGQSFTDAGLCFQLWCSFNALLAMVWLRNVNYFLPIETKPLEGRLR